MPNNACSNKPFCIKPMVHYTLFFTFIVFVTLSKLFTSTAVHWFYALQCLYHSLTFQKICLCLRQTNIKISEVQKITNNAFRKSKYVFSKLRNVIQIVQIRTHNLGT